MEVRPAGWLQGVRVTACTRLFASELANENHCLFLSLRICSADAAQLSQGSTPATGGSQGAGCVSCSAPIAVVIEPARDLAEQTAACLQEYAACPSHNEIL